MTLEVSPISSSDRSPAKREAYLAELLGRVTQKHQQEIQAASPNLEWLDSLRKDAIAIVQEQSLPTTRNEEWRFTDLASLVEFDFQPAAAELLTEVHASSLLESQDNRLVFVNGTYRPQLSRVAGLPEGLFVGTLADLPAEYGDRLSQYLGKQSGAEEVFTALNTAALSDAAIFWVKANQQIERPIQVLFISTSGETPAIAQPRCLVVAESGSSLTLVEEYIAHSTAANSPDESVYFTNAVTEIWVAENAEVNHTRVQRDSKAAFHIGKTAVSQARDSRYTCTAISLGAKLSRHNLEIYQTGEQTQTTLNGLTMLTGEQVGDTHSAIAFTKPHSASNQVHKCIVDDRAHAIFNGKIFVPKPAQLTDARQLSKNLLLSSKARVDTKPQLEITADNVKCAHGATVSQLDSDEVFYLQSRGIDADSARKLLVYAFAYDVISQIPVESLRADLASMLRSQQL